MPISLTNNDDTYIGSLASEHIIGKQGNDIIIGGGGADTLEGWAGDDELISYGSGGLLAGNTGNDYLEAKKTAYGQYHLFGGDGNDTIVMHLGNNPGWGHQGYHVHGGDNADAFRFVGVGTTNAPMLSRIDDFDASQDSIWIDDTEVDLDALPNNMRVVDYLGQQWLVIDNNVMIGLEGARMYAPVGVPTMMGNASEKHFHAFPANLASLATVEFNDQVNFVPFSLYENVYSSLNQMSGTTATSGADYFYGGSENSILNMGGGNDVVNAGKGRDTIFGGGGDDLIAGGTDNDVLFGDAGNDQIWGGSGDDKIFGGTGSDTLHGGTGDDRIIGDSGNDLLFGGNGLDTLRGGVGNDTLNGGNGADRLYGGHGFDTLKGGSGNDLLHGGNQADRLIGNAGNDTLNGGNGADRLYGGNGFDTLNGGNGNDTMTGGAQADQFIFVDAFGDDVITDFNAVNNFERIDLSGVASIVNFTDLLTNHMNQVGTDVVISDGAGNTITLLGVSLGDLDMTDFIF